MRIPKIYLETTMFNFYFADDAPEKRQDTLKLFEEIRQGKYTPYTSVAVTDELLRAPEEKRAKMLRLIEEYGITVMEVDGESERLAEIYVSEGVVPKRYYADGLHIAITTVGELDFIVSYNFQHIVKRKTIMLTDVINVREGYKRIGIYSPMEVIDYEE